MATRLYLTATPAAVEPPLDGEWDYWPELVSYEISPSNPQDLDFWNPYVPISTDPGPLDLAFVRLVSQPLASAVTISGTFRGVWRCYESFWLLNARSAVVVKVVSGDGSVVRGELLRVFNQSDTEWGNWLSRYCPPEQSVNPVSAQAGDRIVIEAGARHSQYSGVQILDVYLGNTAGQDLDYTEGQTDQYNPWWEFSQDLTFQGAAQGEVEMHTAGALVGYKATPAVEMHGTGMLAGYKVPPAIEMQAAGVLVGYKATADLKHRKYPLMNPKSKRFAISPKRTWPLMNH